MDTFNEKMTAIADAIRDKTGSTEPLTLDEMASNVFRVYDKGYDKGTVNGLKEGYATGYERGYEEGVATAGASGLPSGVTALTSGTFTLATDQTSKHWVSHGLGTMPNFFIVFVEGEPYKYSDFIGCSVSQLGLAQSHIDNTEKTNVCYTMIRYVMNNSNFSQTSSHSSVFTSFANDSQFAVYASTSQKLKAGVTYRWIAGVAESI